MKQDNGKTSDAEKEAQKQLEELKRIAREFEKEVKRQEEALKKKQS